MLDFPIDASRIANALEDISHILFRIETALVRLAPPIPDERTIPRRAELSDLHYVTPDSVQSTKESIEHTAKALNIDPNSDLMLQYMRDWEGRMEEIYGSDHPSIDELPWNKAAGKRIFRKEEESNVEPEISPAV